MKEIQKGKIGGRPKAVQELINRRCEDGETGWPLIARRKVRPALQDVPMAKLAGGLLFPPLLKNRDDDEMRPLLPRPGTVLQTATGEPLATISGDGPVGRTMLACHEPMQLARALSSRFHRAGLFPIPLFWWPRHKRLAVAFVLLQLTAVLRCGATSVTMNYGADGNDYFQFTTPSMAYDKASGFTTLITFGIHVNTDGNLMIGGSACASNGVYTGPANWGSLVTTLKTPPTTVTRYEVLIGGYGDTSYADIQSLVTAQGTGPGSILYKNFQALKKAVPGIDAINDDDEGNYDLKSSTNFANMLGGLGYKYTLVPYQNQSFWVKLKNVLTNCDYVYLQCYEGGAGNDPGNWNSAFGKNTVVIPGQESNTADSTNWHNWFLETGVQGGFYYPDVVFDNTYWSAAIVEGNGAVPPAPTGVAVAPGGGQVGLTWNTVAGATSYNVKRSTVSGAETNIASISSANTWPAANGYIDDQGLASGVTYYYKVSAVNDNGEGIASAEFSATPPASYLTTIADFGFETPTKGDYVYDPTGSPWTFTGASPNGSGIVDNGGGFGNPDAPEGVQAAFVQEKGTISQTISGFAPGTNYTISFYAAERPGDAQTWNVTVNGTVIGSYNPGSSATSYTPYTANFTALTSSATVAFVGTDLAGGDNTIFIDDVQIVPSAPPAGPELVLGTSPVTAVDVVGSHEVFTAVFASAKPLTYQWQEIIGGVTNIIPDATNTTLLLANLQLTNSGGYQILASNAFGVALSAPGALTVSNVPAAVNNVVISPANQTGTGYGAFTPTWTGTTNNSLIAGQAPSSTSGNFSLEAPGRNVNSLTTGGSLALMQISGTAGITSSTNYVTCGNGSGAGALITYTLAGSVSGYDLTNITVYGGWSDAGRDQQAYSVYYSTVAAPTTFIALGTVNYLPADPANAQSATRVTLTPASGVLATRVAAVKFSFTTLTPENGYCGYADISVSGAPSVSTAPPNLSEQLTGGHLLLAWPADHTGWQLQMQSNSGGQGLGTNWVDVAGSTTNNQIVIPIDPGNGNVFYRLRYP